MALNQEEKVSIAILVARVLRGISESGRREPIQSGGDSPLWGCLHFLAITARLPPLPLYVSTVSPVDNWHLSTGDNNINRLGLKLVYIINNYTTRALFSLHLGYIADPWIVEQSLVMGCVCDPCEYCLPYQLDTFYPCGYFLSTIGYVDNFLVEQSFTTTGCHLCEQFPHCLRHLCPVVVVYVIYENGLCLRREYAD